jgi:ribulose-phosphate 3-epimerase
MSSPINKSPIICPSMLAADPTRLGAQLANMEKAGADRIHWDIMDGAFVNAITFGAHVVAAHRKMTSLRFDAHLMVQNPRRHADLFAKAGADLITVHREVDDRPRDLLKFVKSLEVKAGMAFNPTTSAEDVLDYGDLLDEVLVMTVVPGRSGQSFMESQLEKIKKLRYQLPQTVKICVDGGINPATLKMCRDCGADSCVTGSYLFSSTNYTDAIRALRNVCAACAVFST